MQDVIKVAGSDQNFEQGFFQLAFDKLQSKLFNLLPYFVGFELVKKSDDGGKAVGVFAFKSANGQVLFVPAFFINGKVKELDTMYSRNNNQFYPLNEDFAELFMKDDTTGLGKVSDLNRKDLIRNMPPVDLRAMAVPPRTGRQVVASVLDFVEESNNIVKQAFWNLMEKNADFTEAVRRFYPDEKIAKALVPKAAPVKKPKIEIIEGTSTLTSSTAPDVRKKVLDTGYAIVDNRRNEEKSKFGIINVPSKFTNPTTSGFYTYISTAGTLRYGVILVRPTMLRKGFSTESSLVLDLEADTPGVAYTTEEPIFIKDQICVADKSLVQKLMEEPSDALPSFSDTYILINDNWKATEPFRILENFKEGDGFRRLKIEPDWSIRSDVKNKNEKSDVTDVTLVFTKRTGDNLDIKGHFVYVPKTFKLMRLRPRHELYGSYDITEEGHKKRKALESKLKSGKPGTLAHVTELLSDKQVFPMTVHTNGSEYFVKIKDAKKQYPNPIKAKIAMVTEFGLDESAANELISNLVPDITVNGYIKMATLGDDFLPMYDEAPSANEFGTPTYYGTPYQATASRGDGYTGNPAEQGLAVCDPNQNVGGIEQEVQNAVQMANSGQKEIFDTQAIATLAKYVDPRGKVMSYIPNFVSTMDKLGRMLFMVYWETEKFQQMYGQDELPELIELLKNIFKNIGDLVIFLKRKFPDISINNDDQGLDTI